MNESCTGAKRQKKRSPRWGPKLARATRPPTERFATMKSILATALALGLLSSTALAADWTEEENISGVKKEEYVRYAFAGTKMQLAFLYALDLDCSLYEGYAYEIIKEPEHGKAELVPQTAFPFFPKGNPRAKCNEQKVEGQMLTYKANAGYKGPDSLTYVMITPSGAAVERTYRFNVRDIPPSTSGPKKRSAVIELPEVQVAATIRCGSSWTTCAERGKGPGTKFDPAKTVRGNQRQIREGFDRPR